MYQKQEKYKGITQKEYRGEYYYKTRDDDDCHIIITRWKRAAGHHLRASTLPSTKQLRFFQQS